MKVTFSSPRDVKFNETNSTAFTETRSVSAKSSMRVSSPLVSIRPMMHVDAMKAEVVQSTEHYTKTISDLDFSLTKHSTYESTPLPHPSIIQPPPERRSATPQHSAPQRKLRKRTPDAPCIIDTSFRDLNHNRSFIQQHFLDNYRMLFPKSRQSTQKSIKVRKVLYSQISVSALSSHRWKRTTSKDRLNRIHTTEASRKAITRELRFQNPELNKNAGKSQIEDDLLRKLKHAEQALTRNFFRA